MKYKTKMLYNNSNLMPEWDYDKNKYLDPMKISCGSGKKAFWKCKNGHKWSASINSRNKGRNCPYCAGKKACNDNCLATINPGLAQEWHPTKNGELTPFDILPNTRKKMWWICNKGHEWEANVYSRNKQAHGKSGVGCSKCSNKKVSIDNCLATKNPVMAKEWDRIKNKNLTPKDITFIS